MELIGAIWVAATSAAMASAEAELNALTKAQLKTVAVQLQLSEAGSMTALITRIMDYYQANPALGTMTEIAEELGF
ncbi:hypothetical protein BV898_18640 [Hypsibius exemplaris]|uniref:SAP domain-containing protein n=1 Tax=Hypsibius exemplaris TaxID=2072580 RepID=A0A9X6RN78_HYPEX|nr:hypothetical protein BV898_18640 [Hypsibius exemplaris]